MTHRTVICVPLAVVTSIYGCDLSYDAKGPSLTLRSRPTRDRRPWQPHLHLARHSGHF